MVPHASSSAVLMMVVIRVTVLVLLVVIEVASLSWTCRAGTRIVSFVLDFSVVAEIRLISGVVVIARVFSPMILKPLFSRVIVILASKHSLILLIVVLVSVIVTVQLL